MRAIARVFCPCLVALWTLTATAYACPIRHGNAASSAVDPGSSFVGVLVLVAIALGSIVVVMGPAADARRSRARRRRSTTSFDAGLAARLARRARGRAIAIGLLAMFASYVVVATMREPAPHLLLLVGPVVLFVRELAIVCRAQIVLRLLRAPEVTTQYDGSRFIFVLEGDELAGWLIAWPSTLDREVARGMPIAKVR